MTNYSGTASKNLHMKLPIIIRAEDLNVEFFYSLVDAQLSMEPIDVNDGLFTLSDANGRELIAVPKEYKPYEKIEITESGKDKSEELTQLLQKYYQDIGLDANILLTMSLAQLVEVGKLFFNKNFQKHK